jgi:hypothetical protein
MQPWMAIPAEASLLLRGIDKTFILQWLKWAEKELGYSGLAILSIILQPTAELGRWNEIKQMNLI